MTDSAFLAYFPDPFDTKDSRYLVLTPEGKAVDVSARELSGFHGQVVTYEPSVLVDDLRRAGVRPPAGLLSINDALRLIVGVARDEGGERKWNFWALLARHAADHHVAKRFEETVRSKQARPEAGEVRELLEAGVQALQKLWRVVVNELVERGESERFFSVEVPAQTIFFRRQADGIQLDGDQAQHLMRVVANEKYAAYAEVAEALGRSPTGLSFWNIQSHLRKTDVADLADEGDGGRLRDMFKLAAERSTFARSYLTYTDASRDERTLRRALTPGGRIYPEFQVHGTVTSRVLVSDPFIQQLRRKYRRVVGSDTGRSLAYMDYAQFEPGILAFLSGDEGLIQAYNQGDMYEALSVSLYGSAEHRPLSKRIFLAYSYGMTPERIARLLLGATGSVEERGVLVGKIDEFFAAYPGLVQFREKMHRILLSEGFVSSLLGNRRWRTSEGPLTHKEMRWAVNQPVQATASLLFKEALIQLDQSLGHEAILLPMHDAVLLQLPSDRRDELVEEARRIMSEAYTRRCPSIRPHVTVEDFAGGL